MPLETASFISQLVPANPVHTDLLDQADAHMRLIKSVLQAQFPNFTASALQSTNAKIDAICNGGLVGSLASFPKQPTSFQNGGGAGTGASFLECDGSVYNIADYPALGAFYGSSFGGNGTSTFGVPLMTDTGRFPRSRTSGVAAGTAQANQIATHAVSVSITDPGHVHSITDPGHTHTIGEATGGNVAGGGNLQFTGGTNAGVTASNTTGITGTQSHTTGITAAGTYSGGTETRPEAYAVVMCVKT